MDTLKQMKDSVLDKAKEAGQKVANVAKDAQERAVEAKDRVMEMADTAKDRVMEMADTAKGRVMEFADTAMGKIKGLGDDGVLKLLKEDHSLVSGFFDRIEALKDDTTATKTCEGLFAQLKYELDTHALAEERLFYPILKEYDAPMMQEAYAEHAEVKRMLSELSQQKGPDWFARLATLKEKVQLHVAKEEGPIFALARKVLTSDELNALGARLQAEKLAMTQEPELSTQKPVSDEAPAAKSSAKSLGRETDRGSTRTSGSWAHR
jgi:hemerythrin superfamily protein